MPRCGGRWSLPVGVLAFALAGCGSGGEEMPETTEPSSVAFTGKPDPAYAGSYKTADGRSTYTFSPTGDFELKGKVATQAGVMDQNVKGSWSVDGDKMLFKYSGSVVPYKMVKDGNKLKLTLTGTMKKETILVKQ